MIDKTELTRVIEEAIDGTDLFLVQVTVSGDNVINVDLDSESGVDIDQCVMVNDAVLAAFDRDVEDYELTVGSAGSVNLDFSREIKWVKPEMTAAWQIEVKGLLGGHSGERIGDGRGNAIRRGGD